MQLGDVDCTRPTLGPTSTAVTLVMLFIQCICFMGDYQYMIHDICPFHQLLWDREFTCIYISKLRRQRVATRDSPWREYYHSQVLSTSGRNEQ